MFTMISGSRARLLDYKVSRLAFARGLVTGPCIFVSKMNVLFDRMRRSKIKPATVYHNDYYGYSRRVAGWNLPLMKGSPALRRILLGLFPALAMVLLAGCSSDGGGAISTQAPVAVPTGSIQVEGLIKPVSTTVTSGAATPDSVALGIDEVAISTDGNSYDPLIMGEQFDSQTSPPTIGAPKAGLATGTYKSLKLSVSNLAWNGNWTFTNPSPCDNSASGTGSGSLDLSNGPLTLYFKTADLGGNSLLHYQLSPPISGYAGDSDHPFLLPAAIQVLQDETTTVSLVLDTKNTVGCSHLSVFNTTDNGNIAPLRDIVGSDTELFGVSGLVMDTYRNQFVVTNGISDRLTIYPLNAGANSPPVSSIAGMGTRLNDPVAVALYLGLNAGTGQPDHSGDQYIVVNRNNNSIATFSTNDSGDATPGRTISGLFTGLSKPTDLVLDIDPFADGNPDHDEILVANNGNDSITTYTRVGNGDTLPVRTLQGSLTGLSGVCGVGIDKQHHEVFVTNSATNTITVYDLYDLDGSRNVLDSTGTTVLTSPHLNIPPLLTITSAAGLSDPCDIVVDAGNDDIYVANKGNDSISVFDLAAIPTPEVLSLNPAAGPLSISPKRSIAGSNTGIHQPIALQLSGGELLVTHNGGEAVMAQTPQIIPAFSNESSTANSVLNGEYNIVKFGIDLHRGTNGLGIQIPVLHAERGIGVFDPQATNGPTFTFQRDSSIKQFQRQILEPGCDQLDLNVKNGFFGVAAGERFYAFTQDNPGILNGSYLPDGESFAAVSYNGDEMYVVYGTKSTGLTVPYLSNDGTSTGNPVYYAYFNYNNFFQGIARFLNPPGPDYFRYGLYTGYLYTEPAQFRTLFTDTDTTLAVNPMGDYANPSAIGWHSSFSFRIASSGASPTYLHTGGLFENPGYGMAGAISKDSQSFFFVNDIATVDANDCQTTAGIGVGLLQHAPGTFKTNDIKGTYNISGIGDNWYSPVARDKYFSMSGKITFDGAGSATLEQTINSEGDITNTKTTYSYQVVSNRLPSAKIGVGPDNISTDVLTLYSTTSTTTPYASALIGMDGKILTFYQADSTRLLGVALLQSP